MAVLISPVVRAILKPNLDMPADEVIKLAKRKGVTAPEKSVRRIVKNLRSDMKKAARPTPAPSASKPTPVPAAARETAAPAASSPTAAADVSGVLANVALVNKVVLAAGGIDNVWQVAEAVRACGGVEEFLRHLELVAGIRGGA